MIDALPSCARLHPGIESQITVSRPHYIGSRARTQRNCRECQRARRQSRKTKVSFAPASAPLAPYGVARLNWTAPEFLLDSQISKWRLICRKN
jgi:hypothetical protein